MKLSCEIENGIGVAALTPAAPASTGVLHASAGALREFLETRELKGAILKGPFDAALPTPPADPAAFSEALTAASALLKAIAFSPVPVVAVIQQDCLEAGFALALACQFRVTSSQVQFGFPECGNGRVSIWAGAALLEETMPPPVVQRCVLLGEQLNGRECHSLGLVDRLEDGDALERSASALLNTLVGDRPPEVVRSVMTSIHNGRRIPREDAFRAEAALFLKLAATYSGTGEADDSR